MGTQLDQSRASVHHQSHGEGFLSLFKIRFDRGIYILDEPESALSPFSQLTFLSIIDRLEKTGNAQFLIATHSPMLICYPGATVLALSEWGIAEVDYRETEHYKVNKSFLECPERYLKLLFEGEGE